jgi:hypothetical protein
MAEPMVFEALRLLIPRDVPGCGKIRIGGPGDGGYVLLDRLDPHQIVMSFGVGPTVTFDAELAEAGHTILLFDHTVEGLPQDHPNMRWFRIGLCGPSDRAADLATLSEHMALVPDDAIDPILKIDVEGAEWTALGEADPADLCRFAQITLELHHLLRLNEPAFRAGAVRMLEALARDFALVHVHANNWGEMGEIGGFRMADTLELTYARRDLFPTVPSRTVYPTALDTPNCDFRPDIQLDFWPFHPGAETLEFHG